jgi:hypothetical protein
LEVGHWELTLQLAVLVTITVAVSFVVLYALALLIDRSVDG